MHLIPGSVWMVKSCNECDTYYNGMSAGCSRILILSVFEDIDKTKKFTYVKLNKYRKRENDIDYLELQLKTTRFLIDLSELYQGVEQALDYYICNLSINNYRTIIELIQRNFNITIKDSFSEQLNNKEENKSINNTKQEMIHKFGINVFVTQNKDVKLSKSKKLILSKKAKDDIIYNSKTDEDIRNLCDKYQIYPIKAIKEIKNRLVYQHRQKEG